MRVNSRGRRGSRPDHCCFKRKRRKRHMLNIQEKVTGRASASTRASSSARVTIEARVNDSTIEVQPDSVGATSSDAPLRAHRHAVLQRRRSNPARPAGIDSTRRIDSCRARVHVTRERQFPSVRRLVLRNIHGCSSHTVSRSVGHVVVAGRGGQSRITFVLCISSGLCVARDRARCLQKG